ncbi:DEKNAAC102565 [Brettanomyces naardenensis]|uniref:RNA polymerase II transcription factor B subunit 2 n=1 Tax=Brettanomyces naardenensis TaxID=13370 RepID=A0A448YLH9_BRENA|nr:DEKNAAC102565 [Brettanomyces naardenensis]
MTLLFQETAIPYADLNRWIKPQKTTGHRRNANKIYQNESIKRLKALNLLKEIKKKVKHPTTGKMTTVVFVQLNPIFRQSFRDALTGFREGKPRDQNELVTETIEEAEAEKSGGASRESSSESAEGGTVSSLNELFPQEKVTIPFLDKYCLSKWENILHFMVGSEIKDYPSIGVLTLLRYSGLMELPSDRKSREDIDSGEGFVVDDHYIDGERTPPSGRELKSLLITKNGFQFLLQEINSQIWTLLLQYLKMSEKLMMNPVDVLNFIFMLGSLELGEGYPIKMLSDTQLIMLEDLIDYGLIYYPGKEKKMFYPTRLATSLTSESTTFKTASAVLDEQIAQVGKQDSSNQECVIIETNFKIYCYTTSPLQIAILNLFVHLKTRFANMVTGVVTRDSVRRALINGISADQIVSYLETHAHPGMIKKAEERYAKKLEFETSIGNSYAADQLKFDLLPPTVVDQIKLWQLELDRIQAFKGYLYKDFANDVEFEKLLNYGEEIGVIVWKDVLHRKFFVTTEGNAQLIDYANRILRRGSSGSPRSGTPISG